MDMTPLIMTTMSASSEPAYFIALDEDSVLQIFLEHQLTVTDSHKAELFLTASQLTKGKITTGEFCDLTLTLVSLIVAPAVAAVHGAPQILAASLEFTRAATAAAAAIKERAITSNTSARYLYGLELAKGLAPESIRVVAAIQEITEKTLVDHEIIKLESDARAIQEFVTEELFPFLRKLEQRGQDAARSVDFVRHMKTRLETKIDMQRSSIHLIRQRIEEGLLNMRQETYYIKTNHLEKYASACVLETLLHAYHAILGLFDPEDFMVGNDWESLVKTASMRCQSITDMFISYSKGRQALLTTKSE
jgi:hypothetical protein